MSKPNEEIQAPKNPIDKLKDLVDNVDMSTLEYKLIKDISDMSTLFQNSLSCGYETTTSINNLLSSRFKEIIEEGAFNSHEKAFLEKLFVISKNHTAKLTQISETHDAAYDSLAETIKGLVLSKGK